MKVRVTNKTSASITIEDLGITLQRSGGSDSSCVITDRQYSDSKDVKNLSSWLRIEPIPEADPPKNMKPLPVHVQQAVIEKPQPPQKPQTSNHEFLAVNESLRSMNEKLSQIVELLAKMFTHQSQSQTIVKFEQNSQTFTNSGSTPSKVESSIFIPSSILPKDAEARINVKESSKDSSGFDSSAAALKKFKKK